VGGGGGEGRDQTFVGQPSGYKEEAYPITRTILGEGSGIPRECEEGGAIVKRTPENRARERRRCHVVEGKAARVFGRDQ